MNHTINILYAEDDCDDVEFFEFALSRAKVSYRLTTVTDGEAFTRTIKNITEPPHIIFIDINMPKINGIDCLKDLRRLSKFNETPVIMLSTGDYHIEETFNSGANMYISKNNFAGIYNIIFSDIFKNNSVSRLFPVTRERFYVYAHSPLLH